MKFLEKAQEEFRKLINSPEFTDEERGKWKKVFSLHPEWWSSLMWLKRHIKEMEEERKKRRKKEKG
jgi:predicted component of type VI protein secretion system